MIFYFFLLPTSGQVTSLLSHTPFLNRLPVKIVICLVQDIVLKNAESWARLVRQSVTPTAIKSSKESFQHFRKAAMEKEEREKALKKRLIEDKKEKEAPDADSRYPQERTNPNLYCFVQFQRLKLL